MHKKQIVCFFFCCQFVSATAHANFLAESYARHPFYFGLTTGYGSTTWQGLVPSKANQNDAIMISTPTTVKEGGILWGFFAGYELIPTFAMELSYARYVNAEVNFDPQSLVTFQYDGLTKLTTHTETAALVAKIMLFIPCTSMRAFSSAGISGVHRWDQLNDTWRASPTFAIGINSNFTARIMGEIGFNYTGGYGESEINPAEDYVPFLYSAFVRVAYRF